MSSKLSSEYNSTVQSLPQIPTNGYWVRLSVVGKFCLKAHTPKAFASFSPGLLQPWGTNPPGNVTLKALAKTSHQVANAFSVLWFYVCHPRVETTLGSKLANAFGVCAFKQTDALPEERALSRRLTPNVAAKLHAFPVNFP